MPWDGDLGHLEGDVAAVADDLGADFDQLIEAFKSAATLPDEAVRFGSRVDGAMARAFLTLLQHWSGAVTCPAC